MPELNGSALAGDGPAEASIGLPAAPRLRVLFVTEDEPFHMAAAFAKLIRQRPDWLTIAGIAMLDFAPPQGRGSKLNLFRSIAAHGIKDAARATARFIANKVRPTRRLTRVARVGGIAVHRISSVSGQELEQILARTSPDAVVTIGLNRIIPAALWRSRRTCWINVHLGLLPRHRGAAPVFWALHDGDAETGLSVHLIAEKIDGGALLAQRRRAIERRNLVSEVGALRMLAVDAVLEALDRVRRGDIPAPPAAPLEPIEPLPTAADVRRFRQRGNRLI